MQKLNPEVIASAFRRSNEYCGGDSKTGAAGNFDAAQRDVALSARAAYNL